MLKVGVTGGIGSGKSTVCKIFECLSVPVFHADHEGRRLIGEDKKVQKEIAELFGKDIVTNGEPDRRKIASIVFNDPEKLTQLNAIIHPAVRKAFGDWLINQHCAFVIEEVAILFESGADKGLDAVIVVTAPEKLRIERAMKRDTITEVEVKSRMARQWSEEERKSRANYLITNNSDSLLIPQVISLYKELSSKGSHKKP